MSNEYVKQLINMQNILWICKTSNEYS